MKPKDHEKMSKEFDRQFEQLLQKGYPDLAGVSVREFIKQLRSLRAKAVGGAVAAKRPEDGNLPFVIVVKIGLAAADRAMQLVEREGKKGFVGMYPVEPKSFEVIDDVKIPRGMAYLLMDIDRGERTLNMAPQAAIKILEKKRRSPLTIDEGIAIITLYPGFLKKNNCFSLLASRRGDRRVPALWLSENKPKLGWCWDGNPHTWLGSASCGSRIGT